ncbi:allantoate amidohydrolase [Burkholderia multivorans]|nr:allantoate amidohydrolase [Burkholderia multivorans]SAJ90264.1 allantoate amidohydrolase [Burkholderia multivorans]
MRGPDLDVRIDHIGNVFGTLHAGPAAAGPQPLMIGSHIDTVKNAGALDGCYGVLAGLASRARFATRASNRHGRSRAPSTAPVCCSTSCSIASRPRDCTERRLIPTLHRWNFTTC